MCSADCLQNFYLKGSISNKISDPELNFSEKYQSHKIKKETIIHLSRSEVTIDYSEAKESLFRAAHGRKHDLKLVSVTEVAGLGVGRDRSSSISFEKS